MLERLPEAGSNAVAGDDHSGEDRCSEYDELHRLREAEHEQYLRQEA